MTCQVHIVWDPTESLCQISIWGHPFPSTTLGTRGTSASEQDFPGLRDLMPFSDRGEEEESLLQ